MTFAAAFEELADEYRLTYDSFGRDDLVHTLCDLRELQANIRHFTKGVEADLLAHADEKRFVVDGLGEVQIKKQTKRTGWRHDELLPVLIARLMDEPETIFDPETGELLPYVQIGHNLTGRLRDCVSFGAGKVTGLRALGLQPDEWCHEEEDGWGVQLPPRPT